MDLVRLKQEEFLEIQEDKTSYYGGDQAWFSSTVGQYGGCGVVAAANITAYLARQKSQMAGLYPYANLERKNFVQHMESIYSYVAPWKVPFIKANHPPYKHFGWTFGVWPASRLRKGVETYGKSQGILLKGKQCSSMRPLSELVAIIRQNLEQDNPVAMLIGRKPRYENTLVVRPDGSGWNQIGFACHWVVITALQETKTGQYQVKVSTWGGSSWLDLNQWQQAGSPLAAIVWFLYGNN